jgi:hypothetical protein
LGTIDTELLTIVIARIADIFANQTNLITQEENKVGKKSTARFGARGSGGNGVFSDPVRAIGFQVLAVAWSTCEIRVGNRSILVLTA